MVWGYTPLRRNYRTVGQSMYRACRRLGENPASRDHIMTSGSEGTISRDERGISGLQFKFVLSYITVSTAKLHHAAQQLPLPGVRGPGVLQETSLQSSVSVMVCTPLSPGLAQRESEAQALRWWRPRAEPHPQIQTTPARSSTPGSGSAAGVQLYTEGRPGPAGNDAFPYGYHDGAFRSRAGRPLCKAVLPASQMS